MSIATLITRIRATLKRLTWSNWVSMILPALIVAGLLLYAAFGPE